MIALPQNALRRLDRSRNSDCVPVAEPNSSGPPDRVILETLSASLGSEQPLRIKPYLQNLALQFESLGGTGHGCEFGVFQRSLGVEPLGLLRWADLGPD